MFGTVLGALGLGSAGQGLGVLGDVAGNWATSSAKQSLNKSITKTNLKYQKEYDLWTQQQDKAYEQWYQDYMYGLQNNEYYKLAQKYAENTASWAVRGLKKAGINPILAGSNPNLSSDTGNASPSASGHKVGGGSVRGASSLGNSHQSVDLAAQMHNISSAKQADAQSELTSTEAEVADKTKDARIAAAGYATDNAAATNSQIMANTAKTSAEADLVKANAIKTSVDTINQMRNSGLGGVAGAAFRIGNEISHMFGGSDSSDSVEKSVFSRFGLGGLDHSGKSSAPVVKVQKSGTEPWYKWSIREHKQSRDLERFHRYLNKKH